MSVRKFATAIVAPALVGLAVAFGAAGAATASAPLNPAPVTTTENAGQSLIKEAQYRRGPRWRRGGPRFHRRAPRRRAFRRRAHIRWCFNHYQTYQARSNTYIGYDRKVHQCRSPFGAGWRGRR